jgi:hypothetical protein
MFLRRFALMMAPQILMEDDFRQGLDLTNSWAITRFPPRLSADDGPRVDIGSRSLRESGRDELANRGARLL